MAPESVPQSPLPSDRLRARDWRGRPGFGFESRAFASHACVLHSASVSSFRESKISHIDRKGIPNGFQQRCSLAQVRKIRTTVRTTRHLSDWPRSKTDDTIHRVSMGRDRPLALLDTGVGANRHGLLHQDTTAGPGHTSQTPSTPEVRISLTRCCSAGRHHTMEPASAVESAREPLTS